MKTLTILPNDAGQRADKFIVKACKGIPPALLYKSFRKKRIKRNGARCQPAELLSAGDVLTLYLNDEFFEKAVGPFPFLQASARLEVLYEDENILLCNKEPGLVVHEDEGKSADTLIARIQRRLYERGEYDPRREQSFAPALCNRIDRNTSGIVIAAKNAEALRIMNEKIKNRELEKLYRCVVLGAPNPPAGELRAYLRKDAKENRVTVFNQPSPGVKEIATAYRTLQTAGELCLLEVFLKTGRTHQIRAHFAHIGHPLLGDGKYGDWEKNHKYHVTWQALCAYRLRFRFESDAGILNGVNGLTVCCPRPWFETAFFE